MGRGEVIEQAIMNCLKELYSYVQPKTTWKEFENENKEYSKEYKKWERYSHLKHLEKRSEREQKEFESFPAEWADKTRTECIGPSPYEFYYLDKEILKDICDSYVYAYRLDGRQELLDTIETLKNYCEDPIVDKYIEGRGKPGDDDWEPGHRGYEHPDNLEKEISRILCLDNTLVDPEMAENAEDYESKLDKLSKQICDKFFEFLDMAGNFYNWTRDLNTFNTNVYLGPSPNSNKEAVIENWKQYRNKDIEIDENQMKIDYYGEEEY